MSLPDSSQERRVVAQHQTPSSRSSEYRVRCAFSSMVSAQRCAPIQLAEVPTGNLPFQIGYVARTRKRAVPCESASFSVDSLRCSAVHLRPGTTSQRTVSARTSSSDRSRASDPRVPLNRKRVCNSQVMRNDGKAAAAATAAAATAAAVGAYGIVGAAQAAHVAYHVQKVRLLLLRGGCERVRMAHAIRGSDSPPCAAHMTDSLVPMLAPPRRSAS